MLDYASAKKSILHLQRRLQEIKEIDSNAIVNSNDDADIKSKTVFKDVSHSNSNSNNNSPMRVKKSDINNTYNTNRGITPTKSPMKAGGGALGELVIQLQRDLEISRHDLQTTKLENDKLKKGYAASSSSSVLIENLYHDLEYEKKRNEDLQFLLTAREEETSRLRMELDSLRNKLMINDQLDNRHINDNRNNEIIIEVSRQKTEITNLTNRCDLLQNDLDSAIRQATLSNEKALHAYQEADTLRGRLAEAEAIIRQHSMNSKENEKYQKRYEQLEQNLMIERQARAKAERERGEVQHTLNRFDADMKAYLRASQHQQSQKTKNKKKGSKRPERKDGDTTTYLDGESTSSENDDDVIGHMPFKSVKGGKHEAADPIPSSPGRLGLAAAETLAQLLLEEIQSNKGIDKTKLNDNDLKDACVRSALRLVQTAISKTHEEKKSKRKSKGIRNDDVDQGYVSPIFDDGDEDSKDFDEILPLEALGDRHVLARIVAEARDGMCSIEEIKTLRKEQEMLIAVNNELEDKGQALEKMILDKEEMIVKLVEQTNESKKQAHETIDELNNLSKRIQTGKEEISRTEADQLLATRLLEACRQDLQDAIASNDLEHKNLARY